MVYERMFAESRRIETKIAELKAQLKAYPKGKLFCTRNGKYVKWYLTDGKTQTYIPKKQRKTAETLAAKKYLISMLEDLLCEKRAINFYLRHHDQNGNRAEQLFQSSEYKELISPYFIPKSIELYEWVKASYEKNPKYPEQLIYKAALNIGELTFYPDFTIRHPETGKIYYWEHFGMIDDPAYCQNVYSKLQIYTSFGIYPTIQLITTYETRNSPLSPELVEKIVKYYFM